MGHTQKKTPRAKKKAREGFLVLLRARARALNRTGGKKGNKMTHMGLKVARTRTVCMAGKDKRTTGTPVGINRAKAIDKALRTRGNTVQTLSGDTFPRDWLKKDNFPLICGFLAWTIPSSIPVGSFGGESLFWRLNESIKIGFDNFPTGPGVTDPFWIYMLTWHIGLFVPLTLAKIGYEGYKEGYFGPTE